MDNKTVAEKRQDVADLEQQVSEISTQRKRCEMDFISLKEELAKLKIDLMTAKKKGSPCTEITNRINALSLENEAAQAAQESFLSELSAVKKKAKQARLKLYTADKEIEFEKTLLPEILAHLAPMLQWEQNNLLSSTYTPVNPDFKNSSGMLNRSSYDIAVAIFSALDKRKSEVR